MKIVVSVHELATETQLVIDNMRRSNAPVLIGDPNKPVAVLIALEEYDRLLREAQKASAAAAAAASAGVATPSATDAATSHVKPVAEVEAAGYGERICGDCVGSTGARRNASGFTAQHC
jgi:PHD/YefM family antitoxin component YafN of YafNO toxin-antitoxin module